ncbi:MAG TPA: hypothetical protein ENJ09_03245 [Planctomycetes bacterium]|nr:hypothetical protein [Planctomycetota bacterium]
MEDVLCFSVDAESDWGEPIAKGFGVTGYPTMLFLNPDGSVRDKIGGYLPPEPFVSEVNRIKKGEGTIVGLRKKVEADPKNLEARYELAMKLREFGDDTGYQEQIEAIKALDPEGKSEAMALIQLDEVLAGIDGRNPDAAALEAFLAKATNPKALFRGHDVRSRIYAWKLQNASEEQAGALRASLIDAYRNAWAHCPESQIGGYGNSIAWNLWEMREDLANAEKAFALEVAKKAAAAAGDASTLDTLACCQFMNGDVEGANATIDRAIELEPDNKEWQDRKKLFQTEG